MSKKRPKFKIKPHNFLANIDYALNQMSEDQLRILYRKTGERLKLITSAKQLQSLSKFSIADKVYFQHHDKRINGTIIRINRRTATIMDENNNRWNVSPVLLSKVV